MEKDKVQIMRSNGFSKTEILWVKSEYNRRTEVLFEALYNQVLLERDNTSKDKIPVVKLSGINGGKDGKTKRKQV